MDNELRQPQSPYRDGEGVYRVSSKQIVALAITLITVIGSIAVAYYNNRPDNHDRWYGWQGRANRSDINENVGELKRLHKSLEDLRSTKLSVIGRITELESITKQRGKEFHDHVAWGRKMVRELSVSDARVDVKLNECLRKTKGLN